MSLMKRALFIFLLLFLMAHSLQAVVERIPVYFFSDPQCETCRRVKGFLAALGKEYPLKIVEYQAGESLPKLRPLRESRGYVPRKIPIVLVGEEILEGEHPEAVYRKALSRYREDTFGGILGEEHHKEKQGSLYGLSSRQGSLTGSIPVRFLSLSF